MGDTNPDVFPDEIEIGEVNLDRVTHDELGRVYYNEHVRLPSVSTVLNVRPDPPGLARYKAKQAKKEGYTDFYLDRGTLAHYEWLNPLADRELWTEDEEMSQDALQSHQEYWDRYQSGLDWMRDTWEFLREYLGINEDTVLAVEHYVANFDVGYAGQLDLLYVDPDGNIVLADLKTSKDVYDDYLYQAVAYDHALDVTVDRMEVIRMNPDQKVWEISRSDEWIDDTDELWEEFKDLRAQLEEEQLEAIVQSADEEGAYSG